MIHTAKAAFSLAGDSYAIDVFNEKYRRFVRVDDPKDLPDEGELRLTRIRHKSNPGPGETAQLRPSISTADTVPVLSERGLSFSGGRRQTHEATIDDLSVGSSDA